MTDFHRILANNLVAGIVNFTIWFALTFWAFLETRSVLATGMIAGLYLVLTAALGIWFGSLVDHHGKKSMMLVSSAGSFILYALALALYLLAPPQSRTDLSGPILWLLILVVMLGVIAGNIRNIALPTLVTLLIPAEERDKANGLVGMVTGVGFLVTSAISGFLVAQGGMVAALAFGLGLTMLVFLHLLSVKIDEPLATSRPGQDGGRGKVDLAGTIRVVAAVPGLFALIFFAAFNNLLGGVFMALLDAYGLSMMAVEHWGLLWAFVSCAFILSGLLISRVGLGANPLRTLLTVNLIIWSVSSVFTIQPSIVLLTAGCFIWLFLGPFAEAAEHTTLQKVVPFERQGRVFGFAQSIEQAASPLTAFLIGPLTQLIFIPFMTTGAGPELIGRWYGTGAERGIALVFTLAGLVGVVATIAAFNSRSYRRLSIAYVADAGGS